MSPDEPKKYQLRNQKLLAQLVLLCQMNANFCQRRSYFTNLLKISSIHLTNSKINERGKMMRLQIVSVGKIKEKFLKQGISEFEKRLRPYCSLTFSEVADEQAPEQLSEKELELVKEKEGQRILNKIKDEQYVIALAI